MTLPASGAITLAQVNTELGLSSSAAITLNDAAVRSLFAKPSGAISLSDGYGKSNRTYATLNPADKNAAITLSNGNLTYSSSASNVSVRATIGKSTGKWYWEVRTDAPYGIHGIIPGGVSLDYYPGNYGYAITSSGTRLRNDVNIGSGAGFTTGDVLGFAYDAGTQSVVIYKNGVTFDNGTLLPATGFPALGNGASGSSATANFGASAFAYTPPAGYNPGLYL